MKNANMEHALLNKLNAMLGQITAGNHAEALDQLQNDFLAKTDGSATTGTPDKNDWVTTCAAQGQLYLLLRRLIELVASLK